MDGRCRRYPSVRITPESCAAPAAAAVGKGVFPSCAEVSEPRRRGKMRFRPAFFHFSLHHGRTVFMKSPLFPRRPAVSRSDPFRGRGGEAALFCRPAKKTKSKKRPIKSSCEADALSPEFLMGPQPSRNGGDGKKKPGRTSPPGRAKHAPFTAAAVRPRLPPKGGRGRRG